MTTVHEARKPGKGRRTWPRSLAGCDGKEAMSAQIAKRAAKRKKGRNAYRCTNCKRWHVGSGKSGKRRMMRYA